ncbi:hypothetical protein [Actinophytocola sediminis]
MKDNMGRTANAVRGRGIVIAVVTAIVVVVGARLAVLVSQHMMNSVALVGSWLMLALLAGYLVTRFRPSVGIPVLFGVGIGVVVVVIFAGMGMMA